MDHYSAIKDHLQAALEAALSQDDLLLAANISHPLDLVVPSSVAARTTNLTEAADPAS